MSRYCLILLLAFRTFADDFLTNGASARSVAAGGTLLPSRDGVLDAMALNPAGLATLGGPTVNIGLLGAFARGTFNNVANANAPLHSNGALPYGAFGTPLTRRISIGVAMVPELLSVAHWRYADAPGGAGGVSYGLLNQTSKIVAVRTAAGVGFDLNPRVKLGFTVGAVYNTNTLQTAYVFQSYPALAGLKTLLDLHTSGVGWNGSAGILVQASKRVQAGATYKSRTTIASRGTATGNAGIQFAAIGLGGARPDFRYDAEVDNVLPQTFLVHAVWSPTSRTQFATLINWINWNKAFTRLPVILTRGNNADINGLLGTDGIVDSIPLQWKDQYLARVGVEHSVVENLSLRFGYAHTNSPVPSSTLMPLTAAITRHTVSTGLGYSLRGWRIDGAYTIDPYVTQHVGASAIRAGEYTDSRVRVGLQSVIVTLSKRL